MPFFTIRLRMGRQVYRQDRRQCSPQVGDVQGKRGQLGLQPEGCLLLPLSEQGLLLDRRVEHRGRRGAPPFSAHLIQPSKTYVSIAISTTSVTPTTSSSWREPDSYFDGRSRACTRSSPTFGYRFIPTKDSLDGQKGGVIFWDLFCTRTATLSLHR